MMSHPIGSRHCGARRARIRGVTGSSSSIGRAALSSAVRDSRVRPIPREPSRSRTASCPPLKGAATRPRPPLHVLECVEPRLNVLAPPYPLLQLVDCVRQVAPGPSGSAGPIRRSDPPGDGLADRDGHYDEPHTEGPLGDTEHASPPVSP